MWFKHYFGTHRTQYFKLLIRLVQFVDISCTLVVRGQSLLTSFNHTMFNFRMNSTCVWRKFFFAVAARKIHEHEHEHEHDTCCCAKQVVVSDFSLCVCNFSSIESLNGFMMKSNRASIIFAIFPFECMKSNF